MNACSPKCIIENVCKLRPKTFPFDLQSSTQMSLTGVENNMTSDITVSHGSAYTVVRAMQQVNGNWQFWGCQNSVTPEPIN